MLRVLAESLQPHLQLPHHRVGVEPGGANTSRLSNHQHLRRIYSASPTLTVTPYLNRTKSWGLPYEYLSDPVYDLSDLNE